MIEPKWILDEIVVSIHQMLLAEHGGSPGIRDRDLFESALARPRQRLVYEPKSTIFELAASYSFGLAENHSFIDGNKRVALAIGAIFLDINGFTLDAPEPEAVIVFEQLASGDVKEDALAKWLQAFSVPNA